MPEDLNSHDTRNPLHILPRSMIPGLDVVIKVVVS